MTHPRRWIVGTAEDCDVRITEDEYVSKRHCEVTLREDGTAWVEDLGSTNGTWLRLRPHGSLIRVHGPMAVHPGFVLRVGRTEFPWEKK